VTKAWRVGLGRFLLIFVVLLAVQAVMTFLIFQDSARFLDPYKLAVVLILAAAAGIGTGMRAR